MSSSSDHWRISSYSFLDRCTLCLLFGCFSSSSSSSSDDDDSASSAAAAAAFAASTSNVSVEMIAAWSFWMVASSSIPSDLSVGTSCDSAISERRHEIAVMSHFANVFTRRCRPTRTSSGLSSSCGPDGLNAAKPWSSFGSETTGGTGSSRATI